VLESLKPALLPGVPKDDPDLHVTVGMPIELHRPDGSVMTTTISAIEWFQTPPLPTAPLHLPVDVSKVDVPAGTRVWLTSAGDTSPFERDG